MNEHFGIIQCGWRDAQQMQAGWKEAGIGGLICVAHNVPDIVYNPLMPKLITPADDEVAPTREWFLPVLAFYDWARTQGRVIVHCQAGLNRSVGVFGMLLVSRHGLSARQALDIVGIPGYGAWRVGIEQAEAWRTL